MKRKLNLGCGQNKIEGCINIDVEESVKPDLVADFRRNLPYTDNDIDTVYLFHVIEHIEECHHRNILEEIYRVLKPNGLFYISYPEFVKVAQNYIDNKRGLRDFWKKVIYGRQLYKSDYHVALMDTKYFVQLLEEVGFHEIRHKPEHIDDFNTVIRCSKGNKPQNYEDLVKCSIFGPVDKYG